MSESTLSLSAQSKGKVVVLKLTGSLDATTSQKLDDAVTKLISDGHEKVVIDLSSLKFIASAGLGLLSSCRKRLKAAGGDLKLAAPTAEVLDVFELLSFTKVFSISGNVDQAVQSF